MKPDILSKKRLKKLEDSLHVERNKLELALSNREKEAGGGVENDDFIEKWDEDLEQLTAKLRNLREKTTSPIGTQVQSLRSEIEKKEDRIRELESQLEKRGAEVKSLEEERSRRF